MITPWHLVRLAVHAAAGAAAMTAISILRAPVRVAAAVLGDLTHG
jgi:hypothetical protein